MSGDVIQYREVLNSSLAKMSAKLGTYFLTEHFDEMLSGTNRVAFRSIGTEFKSYSETKEGSNLPPSLSARSFLRQKAL